MSSEIFFLSEDDIHEIHRRQINEFGGLDGVRDQGLLLSALATPMSQFDGQDLYPTIYDKASAYIFHLAKNHPFIDGNKRVAAASAIVFLKANGLALYASQIEYANLILKAAEGLIEKPEIAKYLDEHAKPNR